jgi:signal transduction histidine kinase
LNEELAATTEELAAANEEIRAAHEEVLASNEELAESNDQLLRTNADLDNFIYTASHDLKAPISNIEALLTALLRTLPPESLASGKVPDITSRMQISVDRFKKTIANLTEVVKLQKENSGEAVTVNLAEVIDEVRLDLENQILATQARLVIDVKGCPTIRFSVKNLRSVVYNLLSNALKYSSPDRPLEVNIHCNTTLNYHMLTITDNGLGMETGRLSQLFTMFKRFHDHVEGSGIGLYMVKKMVENAGGKIEVESQVGVGSTFRVYFPP